MMKPEEEIVTARITRKEAERIAANRWMKPRIKKLGLFGVVCFFLGFIVALVDTLGMPEHTYRLGVWALYVAFAFIVAGFMPIYLTSIKADGAGKDEAKKLII